MSRLTCDDRAVVAFQHVLQHGRRGALVQLHLGHVRPEHVVEREGLTLEYNAI